MRVTVDFAVWLPRVALMVTLPALPRLVRTVTFPVAEDFAPTSRAREPGIVAFARLLLLNLTRTVVAASPELVTLTRRTTFSPAFTLLLFGLRAIPEIAATRPIVFSIQGRAVATRAKTVGTPGVEQR